MPFATNEQLAVLDANRILQLKGALAMQSAAMCSTSCAAARLLMLAPLQ
jgi:hypothetical protein